MTNKEKNEKLMLAAAGYVLSGDDINASLKLLEEADDRLETDIPDGVIFWSPFYDCLAYGTAGEALDVIENLASTFSFLIDNE